MRESQKTAPAATTAPVTTIGRVPIRAKSCDATPEATATPAVTGSYAEPACSCEYPSTFCM
jgi:hypothetical protein